MGSLKLLVLAMSISLGATLLSANEIALAPISATEFRELSELMGELRKIKRDDLFVPVARLQLLHLDKVIQEGSFANPEKEKGTLLFARGVAYNIASFTWPGWDDTGPILQEKQRLGLSAARVGLDYAKRANDLTANIYWINGAHELAAKNYKKAKTMFLKARGLARDEFYQSMQGGWIALTAYLDYSSDENEIRLRDSIKTIRDFEHEHSEFFASQIETAENVFLRDKPKN